MTHKGASERGILIAAADARFELSVADRDQGCVDFVAGRFSGSFDVKLRPDSVDNFRFELAELRAGDDRTVTIYSDDARFQVDIEPSDEAHGYVQVELRPPEGPELQIIYRFLAPFADILVR